MFLKVKKVIMPHPKAININQKSILIDLRRINFGYKFAKGSDNNIYQGDKNEFKKIIS